MFSRNDLELSLTLPLYIVLCYTGYDRVLNNLVIITEALESSPSSLDKLTLLSSLLISYYVMQDKMRLYNVQSCLASITQYGSTVYIGIAMVYPH